MLHDVLVPAHDGKRVALLDVPIADRCRAGFHGFRSVPYFLNIVPVNGPETECMRFHIAGHLSLERGL